MCVKKEFVFVGLFVSGLILDPYLENIMLSFPVSLVNAVPKPDLRVL